MKPTLRSASSDFEATRSGSARPPRPSSRHGKNLLVSATGTGKTVTAALSYPWSSSELLHARLEHAARLAGRPQVGLAHQPSRALLRGGSSLEAQLRPHLAVPIAIDGRSVEHFASVAQGRGVGLFRPWAAFLWLKPVGCVRSTSVQVGRKCHRSRIVRRTPKSRFTRPRARRSRLRPPRFQRAKGSRSSCLRRSALRHSLSIVSSPISVLGPRVRPWGSSTGLTFRPAFPAERRSSRHSESVATAAPS